RKMKLCIEGWKSPGSNLGIRLWKPMFANRFCSFTIERTNDFFHISVRFETEGSNEMPGGEPLSNWSRHFPVWQMLFLYEMHSRFSIRMNKNGAKRRVTIRLWSGFPKHQSV